MDTLNTIVKELKECNYKISTDSRKDVLGSIYFAIKGEVFDGNDFVNETLKRGAKWAVTDNPKNKGPRVFLVEDALKTLQMIALEYRKEFNIPVIVIGGSNGKTTSKELLRDVLKTKYKVHSTEGSFNNHLGVPLSILSMKKKTEIAVLEIGANHPKEHTALLEIIKPTHVVVTNNGMDHLEGFGSPQGSRKANKEIYDWAVQNKAKVFVNKNHKDLIADSNKTRKILYPSFDLQTADTNPLTLILKNKKNKTKLFGNYNLENIDLALSIGRYFKIDKEKALKAICRYSPTSKRSEFTIKNKVNFIVDCYNANPTSMKLSLESFIKSTTRPQGVILGDMLELGKYSEKEHKKIVKYIFKQKMDVLIFIGKSFKQTLIGEKKPHQWFPDSVSAKEWFNKQNFTNFTFLLKGSRGIKIEKIIEV
jgi:UDP-N-acetylmuramoyl-tripeptide--D-alanyl-D-alanine ligase